jgi:hypothetical protein
MDSVDEPSQSVQAVEALRTHLKTNTGVPSALWSFSCLCGTRLSIEMLPGTRITCGCGAVHEFTPEGARPV